MQKEFPGIFGFAGQVVVEPFRPQPGQIRLCWWSAGGVVIDPFQPQVSHGHGTPQVPLVTAPSTPCGPQALHSAAKTIRNYFTCGVINANA